MTAEKAKPRTKKPSLGDSGGFLRITPAGMSQGIEPQSCRIRARPRV